MSHTYVKTDYYEQGAYGSADRRILYCHHNHCCDITVFYNAEGEIVEMCFDDNVGDARTLWDAVKLLMSPFREGSYSEYKNGVECWDGKFPNEVKP